MTHNFDPTSHFNDDPQQPLGEGVGPEDAANEISEADDEYMRWLYGALGRHIEEQAVGDFDEEASLKALLARLAAERAAESQDTPEDSAE